MSEEAAWWRGQAAGIPPKALDPDGFPLWPTTTTTTVRAPAAGPARDLVPVVPGLTDPDAGAYDAGATAVVEHLQLATDHLERTAAQLSALQAPGTQAPDAHWSDARLSDAGELWPPPAMRVMRRPRDAARTSPPPKRLPWKVRHSRNPAVGLPAMLVIALLAGFFAWTSAEPFWLDMGQGERGLAQITRCKGDGVLRRCYATFQSEAHPAVAGVPLVGADDTPGTVLDARMREGGRIAYAGNPSGLRVRWTVGLALILLCGAALCWATGAGRLGRFRTRLAACAVTVAAPLVLGLGVLVASY
ncbi:hypothetical protein OHA72_03305 [Dactylosporangium sp. NBC_01737]|uniref:hypothetical protein n=1 Tax=Dactylosporangium sp. NBC_01737 TaxID=2975959 RepID=UPI002E10095C|nr:hypothetical protein OHA72_03305 [Dactylosporangium sp. NBC_01737]